jgi:biopolymer transport protein ExbD
MLAVALVGLWLAWAAQQASRVAIVDVSAPGVIKVGDQTHTLASLQRFLRRSRVREAVIRCPNTLSYDSMLRVTATVQAAGIRRIQFSETSSTASAGPPRARVR